jgi:hypothetical protein
MIEDAFSAWARTMGQTDAGRAALRQWETWAQSLDDGGAAFMDLTDPRKFLFFGSPELNQVVERLVGAPIFSAEAAAPPPEAEWAELKAAFADWASLVSAAWVKAMAGFAGELTADPKIWEAGARTVAELWFQSADAALSEAIRSDAYVEAQRRMIRAAAEARIAARAP